MRPSATVLYDYADPERKLIILYRHAGTKKIHAHPVCPAMRFRAVEMEMIAVPVPKDDLPYLNDPFELCGFCFPESRRARGE
jgi:hypothetical protein